MSSVVICFLGGSHMYALARFRDCSSEHLQSKASSKQAGAGPNHMRAGARAHRPQVLLQGPDSFGISHSANPATPLGAYRGR